MIQLIIILKSYVKMTILDYTRSFISITCFQQIAPSSVSLDAMIFIVPYNKKSATLYHIIICSSFQRHRAAVGAQGSQVPYPGGQRDLLPQVGGDRRAPAPAGDSL